MWFEPLLQCQHHFDQAQTVGKVRTINCVEFQVFLQAEFDAFYGVEVESNVFFLLEVRRQTLLENRLTISCDNSLVRSSFELADKKRTVTCKRTGKVRNFPFKGPRLKECSLLNIILREVHIKFYSPPFIVPPYFLNIGFFFVFEITLHVPIRP